MRGEMTQRKRWLMGKKKIMIADDESYVRDMVASALEDDYIVLEASDGRGGP